MTIEEQQEKQKKVRAINDKWMGDPDNWKNGGWDTLMATEEPFYMHEPFAFKCDDGSESVPYWEDEVQNSVVQSQYLWRLPASDRQISHILMEYFHTRLSSWWDNGKDRSFLLLLAQTARW
jgi:hypothetical protein